jgi:hypothetical protein
MNPAPALLREEELIASEDAVGLREGVPHVTALAASRGVAAKPGGGYFS